MNIQSDHYKFTPGQITEIAVALLTFATAIIKIFQ